MMKSYRWWQQRRKPLLLKHARRIVEQDRVTRHVTRRFLRLHDDPRKRAGLDADEPVGQGITVGLVGGQEAQWLGQHDAEVTYRRRGARQLHALHTAHTTITALQHDGQQEVVLVHAGERHRARAARSTGRVGERQSKRQRGTLAESKGRSA